MNKFTSNLQMIIENQSPNIKLAMKFPYHSGLLFLFLLLFACSSESGKSEITPIINPIPVETYFPPISTTNEWETVSIETLGWKEDQVENLYIYLEDHNTDAFIILKDGRIVIEKYFGDFKLEGNHAWNSASKSLTAMLTGIA